MAVLSFLTALFLCMHSITLITAVGPWCFACTNDFHPAICQSVQHCGDHESCLTTKTLSNNGGNLYSTSCEPSVDCVKRVKRRAAPPANLCSECCDGTLCNAKGCGASQIQDPGRLFCLNCDFVLDPANCDTVDLCSQDQVCTISLQTKFGLTYYKLGCVAKSVCPTGVANLGQNKFICCNTDLCNSNDLGIAPAAYTTTPVPTTPKPGPASASFSDNTLVYNVTHEPMETLDLVCHVTGGPTPKVTWTFNDGQKTSPVVNNIKLGANGTSVLSIPSPDKSKSGNYTCMAENSRGNSSDVISVTVLIPPYIDGRMNQSITLDRQDDINLPCNVSGDNSTKVRWDIPKNIKSVRVNVDNSLTVFNVHEENSGEYKCIAENSDGETEKIITLVVNDTTPTNNAPCTCPTAPTVTLNPSACSSLHTTTPTTTARTTTQATFTAASATPSSSSTTTARTIIKTLSTAKATLPTVLPQPGQQIVNQFQELNARPVNVLQCPVTSSGGALVTWHRLAEDFNHTDMAFYDNGNGILTVSSQMSTTMTGVYECRKAGVPQGRFVIYNKLLNPVLCNKLFGDVTTTKGTVVMATCGQCNNPVNFQPNTQLKISDRICDSAISKGLIRPFPGGDVFYLINGNDDITLLDSKAVNILVH